MCVYACSLRLFVTPWTVDPQAPLSMEFSRQEYGVGCHALLQGIFLTLRLNPCFLWFLHCQAYSLPLSHQGSPLKMISLSQSWEFYCSLLYVVRNVMVELWPVTERGLLGTTSLPSSKRESESVFPVLHVVMTGCDSWSL